LAMVDDGVCDGDYARVRLPLAIFISDRTVLIDTCCTCRLYGDAGSMRSIWQRCDALATNHNTGSASSAPPFTPFVSTPPRLPHITSVITQRLCANTGRECGRERLDAVLSQTQFGQRRGDGGDGSKCDY
jgi:hypothetical protein